MKTYRHIFFDLDHTLWDFETNSRFALQKIFEDEKLSELGVPTFEHFYKKYLVINSRYWANYHHRNCTKEQLRVGRFRDTLKDFGLRDESLAERIAANYLSLSPKMTNLFPNAIDVLTYLKNKYLLHLITNGFAEVQWIKLEQSGLRPFFEHIIISEEVGTQKPDEAIFRIAMNKANTQPSECIMIGDNYNTDIIGAKRAGMDQVHFNPSNNQKREPATFEISELIELKDIF